MADIDPEGFESFSDIDDYLAQSQGELMDINHEMIQFSRESTQALLRFTRRFAEISETMFNAHAIGAKMMADLTGDMILDEYGLEKISDEEDDEDEDLREP